MDSEIIKSIFSLFHYPLFTTYYYETSCRSYRTRICHACAEMTVPTTWDALMRGESGADYIKKFDPEEFLDKICLRSQKFQRRRFSR